MSKKTKRKTVADRTISSLRDLTERIEKGLPIKVTEVTREETPDGPLHTFEKKEIVIKPKE